MITNIMLGGVGGQGLVLMTKIVSQVAMKNGHDVKSNDVVGLSQRGGMIWGNVRFGDKIYSPNIPSGQGDILVSMEPLEALRWSAILKDSGIIIMNNKRFYPTAVQQEKSDYPEEDIERIKNKYRLVEINASNEAVKLGKKEVSNVLLLGVLAKFLDFNIETWRETISENVPAKSIDINLSAFDIGYKHMK